MSGEMRHIKFTVITRDIDHWNKDTRDAAVVSGSDYHDFAINIIADVMRSAGQKLVNQHSDIFESIWIT